MSTEGRLISVDERYHQAIAGAVNAVRTAGSNVIQVEETCFLGEFLLPTFVEGGINHSSDIVRQEIRGVPSPDIDLLIGDTAKTRVKLNWVLEVNFLALTASRLADDLESALRQGAT